MNPDLFERPEPQPSASSSSVWAVGALARAADTFLQQRFNPVTVRGEISGFVRAASGHCYFTLKDSAGQLRCAMFRRAALMVDFAPRDGDQIQVQARLGVYQARGDLQLVVESMARAGQGALFEEFLRIKAKLQGEGLFDAARKRPMPPLPRRIGVVTSLHAAALRDVLITLRRRVAHIEVLVSPAAVQGADAPQALRGALERLYRQAAHPSAPIDLILLVRGGGSIEDLWAFNDELLARTVVASPVPVIVGVGHESDFTIADFVADLRAPTPTGAAELASAPRVDWLARLADQADRLQRAVRNRLDGEAQRTDGFARRLSRPATLVAAERVRLARLAARLPHVLQGALHMQRNRLQPLATRLRQPATAQLAQHHVRLVRLADRLPAALRQQIQRHAERVERVDLRLTRLNPEWTLQRGYAWLESADGQALVRAADAQIEQKIKAKLIDGTLDLIVTRQHLR